MTLVRVYNMGYYVRQVQKVVYKRYKVLRAMAVIDSRHVRWQRSEKRAGHGQRTSSSSAHSCCSGTCGCTPETQYERRKRQGQRSQYYDSTTCYVSMKAYNKSGGVSSHKCCTMLHKSHKLWIERFHVTSSPLRLRRKTETAAMLVYNEIGASMAIFMKWVTYL